MEALCKCGRGDARVCVVVCRAVVSPSKHALCQVVGLLYSDPMRESMIDDASLGYVDDVLCVLGDYKSLILAVGVVGRFCRSAMAP